MRLKGRNIYSPNIWTWHLVTILSATERGSRSCQEYSKTLILMYEN